MAHHSTLTTPVGPLTLVREDDTLVAAGFCGPAPLLARYGRPSEHEEPAGPIVEAALAWLDGDLTALDQVPVRQPGTPGQQRVWDELRHIPAGEHVSYGELTRRLGLASGASRSVGSACGANLIAPIVPCHRVVRADGSLGGYYYGLPIKRWLLDHEAGVPAQTALL